MGAWVESRHTTPPVSASSPSTSPFRSPVKTRPPAVGVTAATSGVGDLYFHPSSIRVDRRQPAPPHFFRIIAAKKVFGIARSGPRGAGLADRGTGSRDFNRGAPIRGVYEQQIERRAKCGAIPLGASTYSRTKTRFVRGTEWHVHVAARRYRSAVEDLQRRTRGLGGTDA